ncbi:MAG: hypothetical protein A3J27_12490 [Candidatus Tectomicrobia bacterium RIFCSPLOWO2_12_FULL_69_37]|nr:MAG: hypothetical protein A3J27_12490 [Candidatus Tectomicrobia bacterium RIFCSPLOWO2_12_FULL_69_37]
MSAGMGRRIGRAAWAALAVLWLAGCAAQQGEERFVSFRHAFQIRPLPADPWRRTPDVANLLALNDPSTSVLYYDNPHTGGVVSLQVVPRHYGTEASFLDEIRHIYRRMLATPHTDMRAVSGGRFAPLDRAVQLGRVKGIERGEFHLSGSMGRRPTARARELEREAIEQYQPFAGPRTPEEVREERRYRAERLTPAYTGSYRGKVIVFLRGGKLYELYYVDHALAFEAGLPAFDAFAASLEFLPEGLLPRASAYLGGGKDR